MGGLLLFSVQTLPPISLLNSGWPHRAKRLASPELNPPVNSDSDLDLMPKEDPEETSAQVGGVLCSVGSSPALPSEIAIPFILWTSFHQMGGS